ncbi:MAG: hypothetical protein MZV70_10670 [Desulfobacterales bacterium]|nr:hypothetical protein [Desulfobacterales bacterium]
MPKQLGPITRIPFAAIVRTSSSSASPTVVPDSENPAERISAPAIPKVLHFSRVWRTCSAGTAMMAKSTGYGISSRLLVQLSAIDPSTIGVYRKDPAGKSYGGKCAHDAAAETGSLWGDTYDGDICGMEDTIKHIVVAGLLNYALHGYPSFMSMMISDKSVDLIVSVSFSFVNADRIVAQPLYRSVRQHYT